MASFRAGRNVVVTLGQSLNSEPGGSGPNSYFQQLQKRFYGRARVVRGYIPGIGWLQWRRTDWQQYYGYWATKGERVVFNMNGGQADFFFDQSSAQTYASMVTISQYVKSLGPAGAIKLIGATVPDGDYGMESTVTAASNGADVTTFTAATGTLNVISTTTPGTALAPSANTVFVQTSAGQATITYTGSTETTLTGCTTTAGTGTLATGNLVRQKRRQTMFDGNALILADASSAFDRVVDYMPGMPDCNNLTLYQNDRTHETPAGARVMLDVAQPAIEALLV